MATIQDKQVECESMSQSVWDRFPPMSHNSQIQRSSKMREIKRHDSTWSFIGVKVNVSCSKDMGIMKSVVFFRNLSPVVLIQYSTIPFTYHSHAISFSISPKCIIRYHRIFMKHIL